MKEQDRNHFNVNLLSPFPSATCTFLAECFGAGRMLSHNYATLTQLAALTSTPPLSPFTETLSWNPSSVCWRHHRLKTCRCSLHNTLQAPEVTSKSLESKMAWPEKRINTDDRDRNLRSRFSYKTWKGTRMKNTCLFRWCIKKKIQVDFSPCFVFYSSHSFFALTMEMIQRMYLCRVHQNREISLDFCFVSSHPKAQSIV